MDCNIVRAFAKKYFQNQLRFEGVKVIYQHLATCSSCRRYFKELAEELHLTERWKETLIPCYNKDYTKDTIKEGLIMLQDAINKKPRDYYTMAVIRKEVGTIKQVQSCAEYVIDVEDIDEGYSTDKINFMWYVMRKLCQKVDMLEYCLTKDLTQGNEEKNDNNSKEVSSNNKKKKPNLKRKPRKNDTKNTL